MLKKLASSILCCQGPEKSAWPHLTTLLFVGSVAFFFNLDLSFLEGSEGLYAQITREIVSANQFVHLTWQGETYSNKPPLFFWLLAVSRDVFGENEFAFRFPGALFALGTMVLTYLLGRRLFSPTAAFWAALIVASSHVFLWYGRKVLFDSTLTFAMTLALFAWVRVYMQSATSFWYVIAFLAMAFGTMIKSIHAFAMPVALMMAHSCLQRDFRALKTPWFWIGLLVYFGLTGWYASLIGGQFSWQFNLHELLGRAFDFSLSSGTESNTHRPFYWYLWPSVVRFLPMVSVDTFQPHTHILPKTFQDRFHRTIVGVMGFGLPVFAEHVHAQTRTLPDANRPGSWTYDWVLLSPNMFRV